MSALRGSFKVQRTVTHHACLLGWCCIAVNRRNWPGRSNTPLRTLAQTIKRYECDLHYNYFLYMEQYPYWVGWHHKILSIRSLKRLLQNQLINRMAHHSLTEYDGSLPKASHHIKVTPSGIRDHCQNLSQVVFRSGLMVGYWASLDPTSTYVLMITASHNPPCDNGVKFSNEHGQSISQDQEAKIEEFVNCASLAEEVEEWTGKNNRLGGCVFVGRDTRESSPKLHAILRYIRQPCRKALEYFPNIKILDYGQTTTPELFAVCFCYRFGTNGITREMTPSQMKQQMAISTIMNFEQAAKLVNWSNRQTISIDCADGVGGLLIRRYEKVLSEYFNPVIINHSDYDHPNFHCGSEYVEMSQQFPKNFDTSKHFDKCVSFDGDGDRIMIYFKEQQNTKPKNYEGDRINAIISEAVKKIVDKIEKDYGIKLKQGTCCTIVSDTGFIRYATEKLQLPVRIEGVSIKFIAEAIKEFDVGAYFQTSGHGSFYLSPVIYNKLLTLTPKSCELSLLLCLFHLSNNNPKGDAFRNFLVFELCQHFLGYSNQQLYDSYKTFNKSSRKVKVIHKHKLTITPDEKTVLSPQPLATLIGQLKQANSDCEIIVRASATESVIRINIQSLRPKEELIPISEVIEDAIAKCQELN